MLTKKYIFLSFLAVVFVLPNFAFADSNITICDYHDATDTHGTVSPDFGCDGGAITATSTLYSLEVNLSSASGGAVYAKGRELAGGVISACESITPPSGTGLQTVVFPTPMVFSVGSVPVVNFFQDAGCTTGAGTHLTPYYTNVPAHPQYMVWNWLNDGITTTHVVRVNSPTLYATTTSPVSVAFDYYQGTPDVANGFYMTFVQALTRTTVRTPIEYLSGGGSSGVFSTTSASYSLPESGDWRLTITLVDGFPDDPTRQPVAISYSSVHVFGINYHDNTTTIVDTSPASIVGFASTSCAILSGSFNLGDCVGFLVIGDASSYSVASSSPASFGSLTLADRFPFAYAYDIGTFRQELFSDSGANASTSISVSVPNFGTITFLSQSMIASVPFAPTIKTILGWLMWLMTIEVIYLTVIRSHNTNTGV